jgi:hypothetical protein
VRAGLNGGQFVKDSLSRPVSLAVVLGFVLPISFVRGDDKPEPYIPTQVGTKWVKRFYRSHDVNCEVTAVEVEKDGSKVVTFYEHSLQKEPFVIVGQEPKDELHENFKKVRVSAAGIQTVATKGKDEAWKKSESSFVFPSPLKPGDKWEHKIPEEKYEVVYTVGKSERVKVPAGTFDAVPVYVEGTQGGKKLPKRTFWYAPGVGGIKSMVGDEVAVELISFTPPKK